MERWEGQVAVVTGGNSEMGAAVIKALILKGVTVAALARRIDRLQDLAATLAPGTLHPIRCNITNEETVLKAFKTIMDTLGIVHILINTAGINRPTSLLDGTTDEWRRLFDVNIMALCLCTREAVRIMRENDVSGHVIHMNSVAVCSILADTLRQELKQCTIKVTTIVPGESPEVASEAVIYVLSTPPNVNVPQLIIKPFSN